MADDLEVLQVVRTRLLRRGAGKDASDPIRIIEQFWAMDGTLLVERDPFADDLTRLRLSAHHNATALGEALGISTADAWGKPCPICENAVQDERIRTFR